MPTELTPETRRRVAAIRGKLAKLVDAHRHRNGSQEGMHAWLGAVNDITENAVGDLTFLLATLDEALPEERFKTLRP